MDRAAWMLKRYEELLNYSRQMLESARQSRWDDLISLEQKRDVLVVELRNDVDQGDVPAQVSTQVAELIGLILTADSETQLLAKSWREELHGLLGSMSTERKLTNTYGV